MRGFSRLARGATQLGFVDVLTAVILLGILLYAATVQFSVYNRPSAPPIPTGNSASR
jgi:multisubunit Na+/H+ antiporter MnhB subunit